MHYEDCAWIVLLSPLLAAVRIRLFTGTRPRLSAQLSIGAVALSCLLSVFTFVCLQETLKLTGSATSSHLEWLKLPGFDVGLGLQLDGLSLMMLLIVTGVGGLIHIY